MSSTDSPPIPPAIVCSLSAAAAYGLPANILLAVADMEGGRPGLWVRNTNGTYDVGLLQFNTAYLKTLEPFGITTAAVAADNCYPYQLAAWRLLKHIREDAGDLWTRAANYHSRSVRFNSPYRDGLIRRARLWAKWLVRRFQTYEMAMPTETVSPDTDAASSVGRATGPRIKPETIAMPRSIAVRDRKGAVPEYVPRTITINQPVSGSVP